MAYLSCGRAAALVTPENITSVIQVRIDIKRFRGPVRFGVVRRGTAASICLVLVRLLPFAWGRELFFWVFTKIVYRVLFSNIRHYFVLVDAIVEMKNTKRV